MDPTASGQEKEQSRYLPPSSKGRQRKKNPKYVDYETDDVPDVKQKTPRKRSRGERGASPKTPPKRRKATTATQQTPDEEKEATDKTPPEVVEEPEAETPKKQAKPRKTPSKKTPAKKTPARKTPARKTPVTDGDLTSGEVVVQDSVQQENGAPKPKRKYVRRKPVQNVEPVRDPPSENNTEEPEEVESGGRRRRGAAKAALKYLHILAKEVLSHPSDEPNPQPSADREDSNTEQKSSKGHKGRRGRKRIHHDSDAAEDEDFVPDIEEEEEEIEEEAEESGSDSDLDLGTSRRNPAVFWDKNDMCSYPIPLNGLTIGIMKPVWDFTEATKKFREEHYTSWVFPEWVPSTSNWDPVPQSDLETYLPQEVRSAAFRVSRERCKEKEMPLQRLSRFEALPPHPERWDMLLYAGGPVWALEWCPTPDGAIATQYIALACHRGMDDLHYASKTCTGSGLVQLWDVSKLEYDSSPDSQPVLAYGLAQDNGVVWHLKWCPAGGWELPNCDRKAPFLPRLGLLAVATSNSLVTIYSLPHPDALHSSQKLANSGADSEKPRIYKAQGVLTLRLGSFKAPRHEMSGLVMSMDWLPQKPYNIMAVGFYDGIVGLWDLSTKSALLRVRESDRSLSLLPYRCLLAHDHAVRALAFCPASRHLLVTAGEDRYVKMWDLRRLVNPITVQKRHITNEIYWPLNAPGFLPAQESAYVTKGVHGVHYIDHNMRSFLTIPRTATLWSIHYSDWLNGVLTSDCNGDVIFSMLPQISYTLPYLKRSIERRFPVYLTSVVPCDETEEESQTATAAEEEEADVEVVGETEEANAAPEGGNENNNERGRVRKDRDPAVQFPTYKEAAKNHYLHHEDNDMRSFKGSEKRAVWKRMKNTELKSNMNLTLDEMPLAALHKVRFNPNMSCHVWVVSGGQSGLVRLNCLRGLTAPHVKKMVVDTQAQFNTLYSPQDQREAAPTETEQL
ncbi:general transcription factor 3C polypeptide 2 [Acanthochromis polyacanthus]|uniref:General transcription factor IIIC, polypeptide 2, beta n=1 Tax=Acanthochromis polyacanthus TaxID=80966 RepID=A0A3Q1FHS1_9TELE|nr:general transcription factor 3C polypeptide 2 [Acanthochromis polyacanthus]XP_051816947.1 general transcription factor 3C polypeptide 2 [Acanthochromis polyacanthus]